MTALACPNVREVGVDLGAVDGNTHVDWNAARQGGASFVYLKRTQHVYPDAQCAQSLAGARAAGLVTGMYMLPGWGLRAATPKAQVATFKSGPGDIQRGKDLPPALDVESGLRGGFAATGHSKAELVELLRQYVLEMQDQLGVRPVIYTSYNQWWDLGLPAAPWAAPCPLWIKTAYRLQAREPVDQVAPPEPHAGHDHVNDPRDYHRIPDTWTCCMMQQFQGDALGFPGFNRTVDVDRFFTTQRGDHGPRVKWLQRLVSAALPAALADDGDFGPLTEAAVRAFQAKHGLPDTGVFGVATFAATAW